MNKPELVLPAGNLEKLEVAFRYGADAVYIGGKNYSLRAYAGNFTDEEMIKALSIAQEYKKKVYVTVNIMAHNKDLANLPSYLARLNELNVDSLIISDLGVLSLANKYAPHIPKTISTQANITNYETALIYKELGAKRVVLAREATLEDIKLIKEKADIDVEIFIHGAMCVSYSGRCLISHYMTGRSANQGACAHPCRYQYNLVEEKRPNEYYPIIEDEQGAYILNSRDLCLLEYIPELIKSGVDAFKIEGRMKSPLYVASVASTYRNAIDNYLQRQAAYEPNDIERWFKELAKTATRPFTNGFIEGESELLQDFYNERMAGRASFSGMVLESNGNLVKIEQRSNFGIGDRLEFLLPNGDIKSLVLERLWNEDFKEIDRARHPRQIVYVPYQEPIPEFTILRKVGD
ncbi:MAG: U32 family peptidase [Syntrophomonadaceae bacterium]|nr:U32 family peptidase [Syntrophomonadaceae bacterium]